MSEPTASPSDQPGEASVARAEHDAVAEAAEEMAAADAGAASAGHQPGAHDAVASKDAHDGEHGDDDHAHDGGLGHDDHAHDGDGHDGERLGPLDWGAWGAGLVGVAAGLLVAVAFALSTGLIAV